MMKTCWECGEEINIIKDRPYHYTESGLDNIYLHGVTQYECTKCGEKAVEIPKVKNLHLVIGRDVVCSEKKLKGQEIKYLRKELGLKSKQIAEILSVDLSTFSRWENSKASIGPVADKLLRLIYVLNAESEKGRVLHKGIRDLKVLTQKTKPQKKSEGKTLVLNPADWLMQSEEPFFSADLC
ncbi:MAG: type II toxin-antitoxin system MqsA family antitoxin [Deltaproteobacteria bacterium]|nr:type II toxin-antitoxin system MqsA family antitoxin [Deltaproteobacteria bacterium]